MEQKQSVRAEEFEAKKLEELERKRKEGGYIFSYFSNPIASYLIS